MNIPHSTRMQLAIIQPSPFCNIDCKYCYLPDRGNTMRMSSEKLNEVFHFLFKKPELLSKTIRILWHAGEPLAVPISFYEEALQVQDRLCPKGIHVINSIQSNGTLLNEEWVRFIQDNDISLGISLDGPAEFHDANRITRSGKGTFSKVEASISMLVKAGLSFHVITVLNDQSLDHPEQMWETYRRLDIKRIHFLIEELQGVHTIRELRRDTLQNRIEHFFTVLNEKRKLEPNRRVYIRELDDNLAKLNQLSSNYYELEQIPLGILSISCDGDVATFSPELVGTTSLAHGKFVFANTAKDSLEDILEHPSFKSAYQAILSGYEQCEQTCEYFRVCGGGQPSIKLYENGSFNSTETPSCQMRIKAAMNVVLGQLPSSSMTDEIERFCEKLSISIPV